MSAQTMIPVFNDQKEQIDGRRQRSQRSKDKILKAMWELMLDGDMCPSPANIAEHAGVGLRSVFRHFEDIDTLHQELSLFAFSEIIPKFMKPLKAESWQAQLFEASDRSVVFWDKVMIPHTASEIRRFNSDELMKDYQRARTQELAWIKSILPKDIPDYDLVLYSLDNIICFSTVRRLREDRKISLAKTKRIMRHMIEAQISHLD